MRCFTAGSAATASKALDFSGFTFDVANDFTGGIDSPDAQLFFYGAGGEGLISSVPVSVKGLYLGNGTSCRIAVGGNAVSFLNSEGNGVYSIEADDVFSVGQPALAMAAGDRLELNGHDVTFLNMSGGNADTTVISSDKPANIVCGQQTGVEVTGIQGMALIFR